MKDLMFFSNFSKKGSSHSLTSRLTLRLMMVRVVIGWIFFLFSLLRMPEGMAESREISYEIDLRWQSVEQASQYHLQISSKQDFKTIIQEVKTHKSHWQWIFLPSKHENLEKIFYRVASISSSGQVGQFSEPQLVELSEIRLQELPEKLNWKWGWTLSAYLGWGNFFQTNASQDLVNVSALRSFFQQKWNVRGDLFEIFRMRGGVSSATDEAKFRVMTWQVQAGFQYLPFLSAGASAQSSVSAFEVHIDGLRWNCRSNRLCFGYGLTLDRSYYWEKTGFDSVSAKGTYSLGPAFSFYRAQEISMKTINEYGVSVGVPLLGVWTSGHGGVASRLWGEWSLFKLGSTGWNLKLEGDLSYYFWNLNSGVSSSTQMLKWAIFPSISVKLD